MDPLTIVAAAVAAGAAAGVTDTTKKVVADAYDAMKKLIARRYKSVNVDVVRRDPGSAELREVLIGELLTAGAGDDEDLLAAARQLLAVIHRHAPQIEPIVGLRLHQVSTAELEITTTTTLRVGGIRANGQQPEGSSPGAGAAPTRSISPTSFPAAADGSGQSAHLVMGAAARPVAIKRLPRDVQTLVGRDEALARIVRAAESRRVASIHAIDGMPGVGKTALAIRAAHELEPGFPDGQFFVQLHAHTPGQPVADPSEVLAGLLIDLGIDPRNLPDALAARSDLWRDQLADKRVLLVLDDAHSANQIEPLLPVGAGCLTLVTSRRRLVALDGATPLALDVLDSDNAVHLFVTLAGRSFVGATDQVVADEASAERIVERCGYLPLAIVLLAGRLAHHPSWTITGLAEQFDAASDRLAELDVGDRAVRAAFTLSYRDLTPDQQLLFRRTGLHPGSGIDAYTTAALAGVSVDTARQELEALYTDHLLEETSQGRYRLHDLLRAFARTLTTSDPDRDNDEALGQLLDYYQYTVDAADRWLARRTRLAAGPAVPPPNILVRDFGDQRQALVWMRAERENLLACLEHAVTHSPTRMVTLTGLLTGLLDWDGPWAQARRLHQRAAEAADRLGDRLGHAAALDDLGTICWRTGAYGEAADLHQRALAIFREIGDRLGQAQALNYLGIVYWSTGAYNEAADLLQQALAIFREMGNRLGQAGALSNLGFVCSSTGAYSEAADLLYQSLLIFREIGNRFGHAQALKNLGAVRLSTAAYGEAAELLQQALAIHREIGSRYGQTQALNQIGKVQLAIGAPDQALKIFTDALDLARAIDTSREQARALEGVARSRVLLGDTDTALTYLREAVDIYRRLGAPETDTAATYLTTLRPR